MSEQIKPCPFCGDEATLYQRKSSSSTHLILRVYCCSAECNAESGAFPCEIESIEKYDEARAEAIKAWNQRHGESDA